MDKTIIGVDTPEQQLKKAMKWIIRSGAAVTALNAIMVSLQGLQNGQIDINQFLSGLAYTIMFMMVNVSIFYITKKSEE